MKKLADVKIPPGPLSFVGLALIVAGFWVLLGLAAGLLAAGVACVILEWLVTS